MSLTSTLELYKEKFNATERDLKACAAGYAAAMARVEAIYNEMDSFLDSWMQQKEILKRPDTAFLDDFLQFILLDDMGGIVDNDDENSNLHRI